MTPGLALFFKLMFGFVGLVFLVYIALATSMSATGEWKQERSLPHLVYGIGASVFVLLLAAWLIVIEVNYLDRLLRG